MALPTGAGAKGGESCQNRPKVKKYNGLVPGTSETAHLESATMRNITAPLDDRGVRITALPGRDAMPATADSVACP